MTLYALTRLRTLRLDGERQAERVLAEAAAAHRQAQAEEARLVAAGAEAGAALVAARAAEGGGPSRVAEAQAVRRYWARLAAEVTAAETALAAHRAGPLAAAARGETAARDAHLRASQRREVVDKAIARRDALERRVSDRRTEAAADDLPRRRP